MFSRAVLNQEMNRYEIISKSGNVLKIKISKKVRNECSSLYLRYPLFSSQLTCGLVYFHTTSAFSSWKDHGVTITMSPSWTHILFFFEPGILPIRTVPSIHCSLTLLAPSILDTVARTSFLSLRGVLTRTISGASPDVPVLTLLCLFLLL